MEFILNLVGYHDWYLLPIKELGLEKLDCFKEGTAYLVETSPYPSVIEALKTKDKEIIYKTMIRLHTDVHAKNISQLADLKPYCILCCGSFILPEITVYGSRRDRDIMKRVIDAVSRLEKCLDFNGNITFLGGNKHADYMANELNFPRMKLFNLMRDQAKVDLHLRLAYRRLGYIDF